MDLRASLRRLTRILLILAVVFVGLRFRNDIDARAFQSVKTLPPGATEPAGEFGSAAARGALKVAWCPRTLESGQFGRIEIPRLGISTLIAEGAGPAQLIRSVGHISTTAFPGQPGNCALAGLGDSFLLGLGDMRQKDVILIDTLQGAYTYEVEWATAIGPNRVEVLDETSAPSLTLVTCQLLHAVCRAPKSFVVRARLVPPTALAARQGW
jgi:LPXTG-site transpeptidase (sortase) family protein